MIDLAPMSRSRGTSTTMDARKAHGRNVLEISSRKSKKKRRRKMKNDKTEPTQETSEDLRLVLAADEAEIEQMRQELEAVRVGEKALRSLVLDLQHDLAEWIVPDSAISNKDILSRILVRLDGSQSRAALATPAGATQEAEL
jgi:hypothetical protein